ncbi:MAG TPA: GxxExxY protein [Candidatus Thermoplasmatota archaeon]|nr:GxxExxY protein [Candidatus Thermoplasmatota archaeon]
MTDRNLMRLTGVDSKINEITAEIVDAAILVHTELGPGLTEKAYVACLGPELVHRGHRVLTEVTIPLSWRGRRLHEKVRVDLLVDDEVPVEVKATEGTPPLFAAQLRNYVRFLDKDVGLLLNFNVAHMREGIVRVTNIRRPQGLFLRRT